ncbi:interaptin-like [Palaemon carinicauda]|uniref:interaptin-like n=1 Tax=Palaemon carinicauda TaxID=392227 RepID=UPI0035B5EF32
MANKLNQLFSVWMNMIGEFIQGTYNLPQNAASVIQERNAACEEMTLNLQGQLRTLQDSLVYKWFSWLLPEAPRFEDCRAVASQEGFLGRWLQRCPWIGGFRKAREELRGCELALRQMEAEALRFNNQLRTRWFVGKLLREFNVGGVEEILSRGNKNIYYLALAAAGAIFSGIMLAKRRMTKEGEGVPELKTEEVTREKLIAQKETEIQKLKIGGAEKDLKMKEQKEQETIRKEKEHIKKILNDKIKQLENDCMKEQENEQETTRKEKEDIKKILNDKIKQLENDCVQKDLKMKEQENKQETIRKEKEDIKRTLNGKINQLENDCVQKDLKMKEQEKLLKNLKSEKEIINKVQNEKSELQNECIEKEKLLEILKIENEALKKVQNKKIEQLKQLVNEVVELKREKDEQERLKAKVASGYQNLEKAYNDKDLQMKELKKLLENLKTENNGLKIFRKDPVNKLRNEEEELKAEKEKLESEYENLKKECAKKDDQLKRQERLLEILKPGHKRPKKFQKDHIIIWKNKVDELNAEKEEQEKLNAKMASDYQNLLKECAKIDLEMKKQERLLEILKTENEATQAQKEQLRNEINKLKAEKQAKENMKAEKQVVKVLHQRIGQWAKLKDQMVEPWKMEKKEEGGTSPASQDKEWAKLKGSCGSTMENGEERKDFGWTYPLMQVVQVLHYRIRNGLN